ncbi:MAG TPA: ribosomal protein S18-alanine N-acetyltransferase [Polyangiaceae bacterium]|nr:ribosomal protein S18-alanine N-acetyltransferase [Polyangiaceae bacterium]
MIIERMTEGDVSDVLAIENASFRDSQPRLSDAGVANGKSRGRLDTAQLREELARPWARLWVARGTQHAVAFLLAWHVADELHILDVATHPELRRRGYGRALMQQSLAYAREHAIRHVLLEVRRSNTPAIRLYRDCGFFAMGIRKRYYPDEEDAVEMVLVLDARGEVEPRKDEVSV